MPLEVLFEDNHLLVVNKPVGIATMGVAADQPSLLVMAKDYIRRNYQKPGNVYLGAMSRLDAPVSGVLVFARTSKAAARLTEQFRTRAVEKIYWALVSPAIVPPAGQLTHWLLHDDRHRKVHVVAAQTSAAKEARLSYQQLQPIRQGSLLEVQLETGRKHQIRVQLARQGAAVVGDRKYGSQVTFGAGIALHARRLKFTHPTQGTELEFIAPLPKTWHAWNVT